jgi:P-type Ca2+ transporter type 2C
MNRNEYWHTMTVDEIFEQLQASRAGLDPAEAAARLEKIGPNELQAAEKTTAWNILLEQFKNIFVIILLIATAISAALGHGLEAIAIAVIVLFAVLLGFIQEYRAERAIEALREMAAPTATVAARREELEIPARDLVPGDVILLRTATNPGRRAPDRAGQPAGRGGRPDRRVAAGREARRPHPGFRPGGGRPQNMVYAGTAATYGRGKALVVATGMQTEFGKITGLLQTRRDRPHPPAGEPRPGR